MRDTWDVCVSLSCSLLPLSLLLGSLGVRLVLVLVLRAGRVDCKTFHLGGRSGVAGSSAVEAGRGWEVVAGWRWPAVVCWLAVGCTLGCFHQGPGFESEDIVVENHLSAVSFSHE